MNYRLVFYLLCFINSKSLCQNLSRDSAILSCKQKENKVLSGVEVLIQSVNKDTAKYSELESNKGITQRKIEDLNRQLKKAEGSVRVVSSQRKIQSTATCTFYILLFN